MGALQPKAVIEPHSTGACPLVGTYNRPEE
jgi:hypothetical protein